jgi:hypothetical protein
MKVLLASFEPQRPRQQPSADMAVRQSLIAAMKSFGGR